MNSPARDELFTAIHEAAIATYGKRLVSLAIFGSWARGAATPASDLDLLVVAEPLPPSRMKRVREFRPVAEATQTVRSRFWSNQGPEIELSPVFKTPQELRKEREFSFYGDIDFIPTDEYDSDDADTALGQARLATACLGRLLRRPSGR